MYFYLYSYGLFRFWSINQVSNDRAFYFYIGKYKTISNFIFLLSLYIKRFESINQCLIKTYLTNVICKFKKKILLHLIFPTSKKVFLVMFTLSCESNTMLYVCSTYYSYHICDKKLCNVIPC